MTVCYIDVDDEITDAIGRIRAAEDKRMVVVLPPGSRISTSRINFRLLAREAQQRDVALAVVSGEPGVRALAISAGLPAHVSIEESEAALTAALLPPRVETSTGPSPERGLRAGPGQPAGVATFPDRRVEARSDDPTAAAAPGASRHPTPSPPSPRIQVSERGAAAGTLRPASPLPGHAPGDADATRAFSVTPRAAASAAGTPIATAPPAAWYDPAEDEARERRRAEARPRRRGRLGLLVRLAVLAALLGGAAYAAYVYLPNASVVLRPRTETAGPITFEVSADPGVGVPDSAAGVIPAERIEIPLTATGEYEATGRDVSQTKAEGVVRFRSENTLNDVPIAEGTRLSTGSGVEFETAESVVVPRASFATGPTTVEARVRAVRGGQAGNVDADAITQVPQSIATVLVTVTNPAPTSGGDRIETVIVTQGDYDSALGELEARLADELATALEDPATVPRGLVLFRETTELGVVTPDKAAAELVDTPTERFSLTAESVATVLAVNEELIGEVAVDRLAEAVPDDHQLFPETITATNTEGEVRDGVIVYEVTAEGEQYRAPDHDELIQQVRGRKLSEARAILERYGSVEISAWPDFVDTMPDQLGRISLSIVDPDRRDP